MRLRIFLALFLVVGFFNAASAVANETIENIADEYRKIFLELQNHSLYGVSPEELKKIHSCILRRAFGRETISPKPEFAHQNIILSSCFEKDPYVHYTSPRTGTQNQGEVNVESRMETSDVGLIRIATFRDENLISREILPALEKLRKSGARKMIVDLRNN